MGVGWVTPLCHLAQANVACMRAPLADPVMEGVAALHDYVYRGVRLGPLWDRRSWFEAMPGAHLVLW